MNNKEDIVAQFLAFEKKIIFLIYKIRKAPIIGILLDTMCVSN